VEKNYKYTVTITKQVGQTTEYNCARMTDRLRRDLSTQTVNIFAVYMSLDDEPYTLL